MDTDESVSQAHLVTAFGRVELMESLEDRVARSVLEVFDTLPAKSKPRKYETGVREWVPLSGIAVVGGKLGFNRYSFDCRLTML
jgi:hypothetical protein